jgi:hypothetical protein
LLKQHGELKMDKKRVLERYEKARKEFNEARMQYNEKLNTRVEVEQEK